MEQSNRFQRGGVWMGLEEVSQRPHMHICIYACPIAKGNNVVKAKDGGGVWVERGKREEMGDIYNIVNNK